MSEPVQRPMLFSDEMVRAILAGRKSQTRRVISPQPIHRPVLAVPGVTVGADPVKAGREWFDADGIQPGSPLSCPFGGPGDKIWVKESFVLDGVRRGMGRSATMRGHYGADGSPFEVRLSGGRADMVLRWKRTTGRISKLLMPRELSRITLCVVNVRAERLQQISEDDAEAEGIAPDPAFPSHYRQYPSGMGRSAVDAYATLWDHLHGAGAWEENPWVWVIEFAKMETTLNG